MASCIRSGKRAKVVLSHVTDVYKNLALENWMLNNWNFAKFNCLFIYQNNPCVVIGRFQNTWKEVNVSLANQAGFLIYTYFCGFSFISFVYVTNGRLFPPVT